MRWPFVSRAVAEDREAEAFRQGYQLGVNLHKDAIDRLLAISASDRKEAAYWRDLSHLLLRSGGIQISEDAEP